MIAKTAQPWQVRWEKFTKAKAEQAIQQAEHNRRTDEAHVWALRQTIDLDLWDTYSPAQTPVAFDTRNNRLNGRHRMLALVGSKRPWLIFPVIRDCEPGAWTKFDQNTKIRAKSQAHIGLTNASRELARVNSFVGLLTGQVRTMISGPLADYYMETVLANDLTWAATVIKEGRDVGRSCYVTAFMYAARLDADLFTHLAAAWVEGEGLTPQLRRLRDEALISAGRGGITRLNSTEIVRKMLNALALRHEGGAIGKKKITDGLWGMRYFSSKLNDGVADLWRDKLMNTAVEES